MAPTNTPLRELTQQSAQCNREWQEDVACTTLGTPSELSRLRLYLEGCEWARSYYDKKDAFYIETKNVNHEEARRLLAQEEFSHIPVKFLEYTAGTYETSMPPGSKLKLGQYFVILSGMLKTIALAPKRYLLTVSHIYDKADPTAVCKYMHDGIWTPCGQPAHLFDEIKVPAQVIHGKLKKADEFERVTADVALLKPLVPCCNWLVITDPSSHVSRGYALSLQKDIFLGSKLMIRDQDGELKYGHIESCSFTDKDMNLYNVMSIIDTGTHEARTITRPGDSGALVLEEMPLSAKYANAKVYGMVTGIARKQRRSMTIVNRLADVLDYCGVFEPGENVDFEQKCDHLNLCWCKNLL